MTRTPLTATLSTNGHGQPLHGLDRALSGDRGGGADPRSRRQRDRRRGRGRALHQRGAAGVHQPRRGRADHPLQRARRRVAHDQRARLLAAAPSTGLLRDRVRRRDAARRAALRRARRRRRLADRARALRHAARWPRSRRRRSSWPRGASRSTRSSHANLAAARPRRSRAGRPAPRSSCPAVAPPRVGERLRAARPRPHAARCWSRPKRATGHLGREAAIQAARDRFYSGRHRRADRRVRRRARAAC